jgi:dephospho-CoA kinase
MLSIGLTGGIGSGKSTIARVFEILGVPVYYADKRAKWLMENNPDLKDSLVKHFGIATYLDESLNKKHLSNLVFNNPGNLKLLNGIVHPFTIHDSKLWMRAQQTAYAIKEAALIFESGTQADFDLIIGVFAPKHLRIKRTMQRDHITRDQVIERMDNQLDPDIVKKLCDIVIDNDESMLITPTLVNLHHQIMLKAQKT